MAKSITFSSLQATEPKKARPLTAADHSFATMIREACAAQTSDGWYNSFKPSATPYCEYFVMLARLHEDAGIDLPGNRGKLAGSFYRHVGIAGHKVIQECLGRLGYLYGGFKCPRCEAVEWRLGTPKKCQSCGVVPYKPWEYCEISLKDMDPTGELSGAFIDGLVHFPDMEPDTYWLIDIKTCSTKDLPKPEYGFEHERHLKYLHQTAIYAHLLARKGVEVVGTAFLMVPRDDPEKMVAVLYDQSETNGPLFKEAYHSWVRGREAARSGQCADLGRHCETKQDRPDCPFNGVCFDRDEQMKLFGYVNRPCVLPEKL